MSRPRPRHLGRLLVVVLLGGLFGYRARRLAAADAAHPGIAHPG